MTTPIAKSTSRFHNKIKDQHLRFVPGHYRRIFPEYEYDEKTGCWNWLKSLDLGGYGKVDIAGRTRRAHRVYYEDVFGSIPEGLTLDHLCRNRKCVNPFHLEAVTTEVNNQRSNLATITDDDARAIREEYASSSISQRCLGLKYGITQATVWRIVHGISWKSALKEAS
jgi:hypothetical protein